VPPQKATNQSKDLPIAHSTAEIFGSGAWVALFNGESGKACRPKDQVAKKRFLFKEAEDAPGSQNGQGLELLEMNRGGGFRTET